MANIADTKASRGIGFQSEGISSINISRWQKPLGVNLPEGLRVRLINANAFQVILQTIWVLNSWRFANEALVSLFSL
jgi:hypothetical protein